MKKFLSILLVLVLVASLFTGCDLFGGGEKETEAETQAPKATLEKAVEFLVTTYKGSEGKETSNNYELIPQITIDGVSYTVTWTVDNENITITKGESGFYVVNLPSNNAEKCEYTLTATVTAPDGKTATKTMKRVLPVISKVDGVETDLKTETAYKLFFDQKSVGKVLFLTAETSGNYIKTNVDPMVGADFYAEAAEGGYKIYTLVNGAKSYIKASTVPKDDGKVSKVIGFDAAGSVFKYNAEINAWYTTIDGTNYTMGTYGTYETVSISEDSYYTPENTGVSQFPVQFIEKAAGEAMAPSVGPADPTELTSIADAVAKGLAMEHNTFTVEKYLVKGTVTEIANTQYGNLYIEDAEGNKIYIYGLYNNDGSVRFDAMTTQPKVGDVITVMSVIGQYNDAAQLKNAWLMNIEVPELSDAEKVAAEKDALSIDADGAIYLDTVITLPATGASHEDVTITWAASADNTGSAVVFEAGKLTVTIGDAEETYKITATIKCGDATETKEFTLAIAKKAAYTVNVVSAPVANTAYKLYFTQLKAGKVLFVNGVVDGRYLNTTMNVLEAVDVYAEAVEGGYKFYTLVDGAKAYLNAYLNDSGKTSLNFAAESACVFAYNAETYAWEVTVGEKTYYAGSYNAFETVSLSETKYINAENTRTAQFPLELVEIVCAHDFDEAKCESTCTICGAASEPNHKYDNACDAKCNVCEAEREVPAHVYDNACDANCNVCNATREVADHVYDNNCDANCNVCNEVRAVADHVYDNECDAQCNECKAERTAPHKYSAACDEKCDLCAASRTATAAHAYDNDCDAECNVCKATRKADCVDADEDGVCDVCGTNINKEEVEKKHIAYEKEQITFADVVCNALTVTLPTVKDYEDVTITWTSEGAKIENGKATFVATAEEQTITIVATFTCGDTTDKAEYTVKVLAHNFAKACTETCGVCGADNEDAADHTWAGCTDTDCDVCGATRTAGEHTFANDCQSTKCQNENCDYNRTAAQHVYADDCTSTKCQNENCDVARDAAEHVWANCEATKCTNCAVTRTPVDHKDENTDDVCDACQADLVKFPKVGTAYKMYLSQKGLGKVLYFAGSMNGYYFATTENVAEAVDVYFEKTEGGYFMYFMNGEAKSYLAIVRALGTDGKEHDNVVLDAETPSVFTYSEEYKTFVTTVGETTFFYGTYGTYNTISASSIDKITTNYACGFTTEAIDQATCEHDYTDATCSAAQYCVVCLKVNGEALGHTEPNAEGKCDRCEAVIVVSDADALPITEAIELGSAQASGAYTNEKYYLVGTITEITNTTYGNMYIADANGNTILIYGTYSADGADRYDAMANKPAVGDVIKVYGAIGNYNGTPQMKNGWIGHVHSMSDATCTAAKSCACGLTEGDSLGHNYEGGSCTRCGSAEPVAGATLPSNLAFDIGNKENGDNYMATNYPDWTISGKLGGTYAGYLGFGRSVSDKGITADKNSSIKSSTISVTTGFTVKAVIKGNGSSGTMTSTLTFTLVDAQGNVVATGYANGSSTAAITPVDAKDTTYDISFTFVSGKTWTDVSNLVVTFAKATGNIGLKSLDFVQ